MTGSSAPFRSYLDQHHTALAGRITHDLAPYAPATESQVVETLSRWFEAIDKPQIAIQVLDGYVQEIGDGPMSLTAITNAMAIYRSALLDIGMQAMVAQIDGATSGTRALMQLIDLVMSRVAEIAMARAQSQAERIERIVTATPLSIIEFDTQGIIQVWNPSAERIYGWSAAEAIGKHVIELLVPSVAREQVQSIVEMLLSGQVANSRDTNITKRGDLITCQWYNAVLRDTTGKVIGVLSQTEDISEQVQMQDRILATQEETLRELSTPLIPLADGLVIMPLIGSIDSRRAQQVIETLLEGVTNNQARMVILDITGVPIVDTQVAAALLRAAQAVNLLGAQVVLTGIRPEIAQTLVGLGVDLSRITTRGSLQSGIAYALGRDQQLQVRV